MTKLECHVLLVAVTSMDDLSKQRFVPEISNAINMPVWNQDCTTLRWSKNRLNYCAIFWLHLQVTVSSIRTSQSDGLERKRIKYPTLKIFQFGIETALHLEGLKIAQILVLSFVYSSCNFNGRWI